MNLTRRGAKKRSGRRMVVVVGIVTCLAFGGSLLYWQHVAKNLWPRPFLTGSWILTHIGIETDVPIESTRLFSFWDAMGDNNSLTVRQNGQIQWLDANTLFSNRWDGRVLVFHLGDEEQIRVRVHFKRDGGLLLTTEDGDERYHFKPQER